MKLSDLVAFKNSLSDISTTDTQYQLDLLDANISKILNIYDLHADYKDDLRTLIYKLDQAEKLIADIDLLLPALIEKINTEISDTTKSFYKRGYLINNLEATNATLPDFERNHRILSVSSESRADLVNAIRGHTDWHYPALEIGPGDGVWTEHLVAADPLYIVDINNEYLQNTLSRFNELYRKRIRPYCIGNWIANDDFYLMMLPSNQFGFIFSWNVFNYFPLYETKIMLEQCFQLLRFGGSMIFSYNNCEFPAQAEYVEKGFRSWMPKTLLINTCKQIGFEIIKTVDYDNTISWIEIRKPGKLKTVKSHQVLGKIIKNNT